MARFSKTIGILCCAACSFLPSTSSAAASCQAKKVYELVLSQGPDSQPEEGYWKFIENVPIYGAGDGIPVTDECMCSKNLRFLVNGTLNLECRLWEGPVKWRIDISTAAYLVFEPGDESRYEFRIVPVCDPADNEVRFLKFNYYGTDSQKLSRTLVYEWTEGRQ